MKRLFLIFAAIAVTLSAVPTAVRAEGGAYLRVLQEDVGFYAAPDQGSLLFHLPYSYYVYAVRSEGEYTYCRYQDALEYYLPLYGYVLTSMLTPATVAPSNPYPKCTLEMLSSSIIYTDRTVSGGACFAFAGSDVRYYGSVTGYYGEVLYYVALGDTCGYVRAGTVQPPNLPLHPDPLPQPEPSQPTVKPTPDEDPSEGATTEGGDGLKIAMIVALGVICLIVIYILFRPDKGKRLPRESAESDYE